MAGSRKKRTSGGIDLIVVGSRENPRNLLSPMTRI
jgi:hypothetical protein